MNYIEVRTPGGLTTTCFVREIPRIGECIYIEPQSSSQFNGLKRVVEIHHPSWPRGDQPAEDKPVVILIVA